MTCCEGDSPDLPPDVNTLMAELTPSHKAESAVAHALSVRLALATGNYHKFFRLYEDAPNMNAYIMDQFIDRERINALHTLSKWYVVSAKAGSACGDACPSPVSSL